MRLTALLILVVLVCVPFGGTSYALGVVSHCTAARDGGAMFAPAFLDRGMTVGGQTRSWLLP